MRRASPAVTRVRSVRLMKIDFDKHCGGVSLAGAVGVVAGGADTTRVVAGNTSTNVRRPITVALPPGLPVGSLDEPGISARTHAAGGQVIFVCASSERSHA